jgi:signal transduction histidine kinase
MMRHAWLSAGKISAPAIWTLQVHTASRRRQAAVRFLASIVGCALLLLPASIGTAAPQAAIPRPARVLLLHSFGQNFSPWNTISAQFRGELIRRSTLRPIDLYEVSLQNVRVEQPRDQQTFLDYLRGLFAERDPDLVVTIGAPAARFFQEHRARVFPSTPLLIGAADVRTLSPDAFNPDDTAVPVSFDLPIVIEDILQVLPDTTTIAVTIGDSPLERFWVEELRRDFASFTGRVNFEYLNKLPFDEMVQRVAELPPHSVVCYAAVRVDAHGVPQEDDRVFSRLREVSKSPIFGFDDNTFGHGAVGGPLFRLHELGDKIAAVAVRILNGERGRDIKIPVTKPGASIYDWRELRRFGISESTLPAGSEIRFRRPTLWEQYRWVVSLVVGVILLQMALIAGLLYERRRRRGAEASARNSLAELAHVNRLATANELSTSMAHEIRQPLAAMVTNADAGLMMLSRPTARVDDVRAAFQDIVAAGHHAAEVVENIRSFVKKSAPQKTLLDLNDLIRTVLSLAAIDLRKLGVTQVTNLAPGLPLISGDPVQLKQVLMNLIMNAAEAMATVTGRPRTLHITSKHHVSAGVLVSVEDSGPGIRPDEIDRVFNAFYTTKSKGMGMGLSISRSIVVAHHGRLWASPGMRFGAAFHLALPPASSAEKPAQGDPAVAASSNVADQTDESVTGLLARPEGLGFNARRDGGRQPDGRPSRRKPLP